MPCMHASRCLDEEHRSCVLQPSSFVRELQIFHFFPPKSDTSVSPSRSDDKDKRKMSEAMWLPLLSLFFILQIGKPRFRIEQEGPLALGAPRPALSCGPVPCCVYVRAHRALACHRALMCMVIFMCSFMAWMDGDHHRVGGYCLSAKLQRHEEMLEDAECQCNPPSRVGSKQEVPEGTLNCAMGSLCLRPADAREQDPYLLGSMCLAWSQQD